MLSERGLFPGEGIPKIISTSKAGVDARMLLAGMVQRRSCHVLVVPC